MPSPRPTFATPATPSQASLHKELDLLVDTGLGVALIAPALSALLAKIVGAEAHGMCWFSDTGMPEGFYQFGSSCEAEELFMNHYEELFVGPHEYTPFWSVRNKGRGIGNAVLASREYFRSNTYNLLIKPANCHYLLDGLVDLDGVTRLTVCFFRSADNPFTELDVKKLTALIPVLRRAIGRRPSSLAALSTKAECGHMLLSGTGQQIEMMDELAGRLLSSIRLFNQNVSPNGKLSAPPRFVQQLCERLRTGSNAVAVTEIELAGGTLVVTASWLATAPFLPPAAPALPPSSPSHLAWPFQPGKKMLVSLQFKVAGAIEVVRNISAWGLSPLQSRILMYAAAGGSRVGCAVHHRVSKEALKKHLREIYAASLACSWDELPGKLGAG